MKKALIYDPYLDTLGGGERYCLSLGECLLKRGWQVDILWDNQVLIKRAQQRFNLEIAKIKAVGKRPEKMSFLKKALLTRQYDLVFWLSDGSIPLLLGKNNLLHFQVPFKGVNKKPWLNKLKLALIKKVICNSRFTKKFIDREFSLESLVIYPPVDVDKFKPQKKRNVILGVGRFEETMQAKRQDILIKAFKKMVDQGLKDWQLVLIGGSLAKEEENQFLKGLKELAKGYPVKFIVNASFEQLKEGYQTAKIFWHAAGYEVPEDQEPWRTEHFGMTTVEAMAAGAIPAVTNCGGLKEIVRRGVGGRWGTLDELIKETFSLIKDATGYERKQKRAFSEAQRFSKSNFCQALRELIR